MRAQLNPTLMEDVVVTEHSWWFPEDPAEEPFLHGLLGDGQIEGSCVRPIKLRSFSLQGRLELT